MNGVARKKLDVLLTVSAGIDRSQVPKRQHYFATTNKTIKMRGKDFIELNANKVASGRCVQPVHHHVEYLEPSSPYTLRGISRAQSQAESGGKYRSSNDTKS